MNSIEYDLSPPSLTFPLSPFPPFMYPRSPSKPFHLLDPATLLTSHSFHTSTPRSLVYLLAVHQVRSKVSPTRCQWTAVTDS